MRGFDILAQRIAAETKRFEEAVSGQPFLPRDEDLRGYLRTLFIEHCTDIDDLVGRSAHHYCWMWVGETEIGLEYVDSIYSSDHGQQSRDATARRLRQILNQLRSGYFYSGLWTYRDGVTSDARRFTFPLVVSFYLVPPRMLVEAGTAFFCRSFFIKSAEDLGELSAWTESLQDLSGFDFESFHLIQPVAVIDDPDLHFLNLLTMQFQREWGNKNKLLERRVHEIAGVSHDLCHQIYDLLSLLRAGQAKVANEETNNLFHMVEGLLISMFGVPWRHRAFRDGTGSGAIIWPRGGNAPAGQDARFWNIIFETQATRVLRARSAATGRSIKATYSFRSGTLGVESKKVLPDEADPSNEPLLRRMLEKGLPFDPWPLTSSKPGIMQFEGEKALILTVFSELIRNAAAVLADCGVSAASDLMVDVSLEAEERCFVGSIDTRLPPNVKMPGAAQRVASRLSRIVPGLTVELLDKPPDWASFSWRLRLAPPRVEGQ